MTNNQLRKYRLRGSPNVVASTKSLSSNDITNTSGNTNTKHIKKVFILEDSMVKHVQGFDITNRIDNK